MSAKFVLSVIVQTTLWLGVMALVLFLAAGNWRWPGGWAFMAIFGIGSIAFIAWLGPRDPALLQSRMDISARKEQPWWDKLFLFVFIGFWFVWMAGMAIDAERWHLSHVPVWLQAVGGVLIIAGFTATMRVFAANSFAAPNIRVQSDRDQHVIDTGPYAWVRHPMYASAALYLVGLPLLLGSWWGFIGSAVFMLGMSVRSIGEENTLKRELPGYAEYMTRVRYRLVPGVF
ncbi:MAG TPA: isoprenylcysteine carboxylmethyltransferase family protein [Rhizomicrobium sp.]|jgi:protein-S-isoprenylcysteine O-methyltransferase Ste14|nr:isoprenylcysteine carboxylmethyltransferase family protein [Rhizomicrobium sp.]